MRSWVLGFGSLAVVACGSVNEPPPEQTSGIIGGVDARASKFAPIGALLLDGRPICTATLIAPTLALTAEHCVNALGSGMSAEFAIGYDAAHPEQRIRIREHTAEASFTGGLIGLGSDVALLYLAEPVQGVVPARLAPTALSDADIGTKFIAIGYGQQDDRGTFGTRKLGTVTLDMLSGQPGPKAFPNYEEFEASWTPPNSPVDADSAAAIRNTYDAQLLPTYEAYMARNEGDVQVCSGDSGGPMLGMAADLTVWGVASWVLVKDVTHHGLCRGGVTYAIFGAKARKFLDDAIRGEALCGNVTPHCDGDVAVRCTGLHEGDRAITKVDCAQLGLVCRLNGTDVGCVGANDPPPSSADGGSPNGGFDGGARWSSDGGSPKSGIDGGAPWSWDAGHD